MTDADTEARGIVRSVMAMRAEHEWSVEGQRSQLVRSGGLTMLGETIANTIAAALRARETQTVEACLRIVEMRRQRILANPGDPSWTEHLAEVGSAIRALAPLTPGGERTP